MASQPPANFLHSWYWGDFRSALGKKVYRQGLYDGDTLVGLLLMIIESAKRGKHVIVPGGPIIDWKNENYIGAVFEEMKRIARIENAIFVRIRPQLKDSDESQKLFKDHGAISAPTHLHAELTSQLDLTQSLEDILKNMRKQTRAEIKKAENLGIVVSSNDDVKMIRAFYERQLQTAKRQGFVPFSYEFLYEQFKVFAEAGAVRLYTATYEDKVLAQAFIIFYRRESAYHYGVSTEEGRKYPGAYAVQWQAIQDAKARSLKVYNFWGVAKPEEKHHRFYSISIFKRGFGGKDFNYLHAHDLVINWPRYLISYTIEYIRNKRRNL